MRLAELRSVSFRQWLIVLAGTVLVLSVVVAGAWTMRNAWSVYKLNRGVGDTTFYDAAGRPWFRLD